ncbi:MAG: saccharopine dehydrogenase NADP-binding domain-containing protein, partial [Litoreibacter sp.]
MAHDKPILVVGGSGVFGSRLAAGLVRDGFGDVIIAGRDLARAEKTAKPLGCRAIALDISDKRLTAQLQELSPWLVIDAAGPFQAYGNYHLAEAAIAVGAHCFDLSDDGAFTAGISALDERAKAAGVVVRSGVSSVPALSAAAVRALSQDLSDIALIETMILPGNRAPRGVSVMKAILAQAGKPMINGDVGWTGARRARVGTLTRLASPIGAPDLQLMRDAFGTRDVRFFAGLELWVMHRGLGALAWAVKRGLLSDATALARPLRWAAAPLYYFGSDKGAMRVRVVGTDPDGRLSARQWALTAIGGDGPHVPALPARVLTKMLADNRLSPGAEAELHSIVLEETEAHAAPLRLSFARTETAFIPRFQTVLGDKFDVLPPQIKALHGVIGRATWTGKADVTRGVGLAARVVAWAFRFPKAARDIPVTVQMERTDTSEVW